jgi:hypothetical protein
MLNYAPTGTDLAIGLAAFLLGWYVIGLHLSRRRGGALVRQIRDSIQAFGGAATIRWIGRGAFRIEVEKLAAPLSRLGLSVLMEPRETFLLWVFGRLSGRRDWLKVSLTLGGGVKGAFEVYHPRRRGGSDSAHEVRSLGWAIEPFPGRAELLCAAPGPDGRALALEVMGALRGVEIWGVRVRNKEPQLTVSLPVPATERRVPLPVFPLLSHLAQLVLAGGLSHISRKEEQR